MNNSETLDFYSKEISKIALLDSATEHSLIIAASNGNISARNKLVSSNLRLVMKIAAQFRNSNIMLEDLVFEGNLGLIHAAEKVDANHQNKFSTYAAFWIKFYIQNSIYKSSKPVRIPYGRKDLLKSDIFNSCDFDSLQTQDTNSIEDTIINKIEMEKLKNKIKQLSGKEQTVLHKRYFTEKPKSYQEIAKELSLSQETIRQIEKKAIKAIVNIK
ncbi:MAG: sigma-70 family RNA polymerase sigma factor [Treponema sp.]|nr:sigma-70 family RNA polymerase sigma factor [Candidatus Treponema merdequi]